MFDSTLTASSDTTIDGQIPFAFAFPCIAQMSWSQATSPPALDGTLDHTPSIDDAHTRLADEIDQAFIFARHAFRDLDQQQLEVAFAEAKLLAASHLFGAELSPNVSVDPCGEFTFYHRSQAGYVDIGVRGEGELSYHVRNDADPTATHFDDYDWADFNVPQPLFLAIQALRQHL